MKHQELARPACRSQRRTPSWIGAALLLAACQKSPAASAPADPALANFGSNVVTLGQVQAQVDRLSFSARVQYAEPAEQQKFIRTAIENEVLAQEAERLGYERNPEVVAALKKAMVTQLLKEKLGNGPEPGEVTEAAMRQYYAEHPSEFGPPEKNRVAILFVRDAARAREIWRAATAPGTANVDERIAAFSALVKQFTEEEGARDVTISKLPGSTGYPQAVADAAAALAAVGDVSALIDTPRGHYIVQLKQRIPSSVRPFEEVRGHAARAVSEQIRDRKVAALTAQLVRRAGLQLHAERFASVHFDTSFGASAEAPPASRMLAQSAPLGSR